MRRRFIIPALSRMASSLNCGLFLWPLSAAQPKFCRLFYILCVPGGVPFKMLSGCRLNWHFWQVNLHESLGRRANLTAPRWIRRHSHNLVKTFCLALGPVCVSARNMPILLGLCRSGTRRKSNYNSQADAGACEIKLRKHKNRALIFELPRAGEKKSVNGLFRTRWWIRKKSGAWYN